VEGRFAQAGRVPAGLADDLTPAGEVSPRHGNQKTRIILLFRDTR
jgi:hypothetical protein